MTILVYVGNVYNKMTMLKKQQFHIGEFAEKFRYCSDIDFISFTLAKYILPTLQKYQKSVNISMLGKYFIPIFCKRVNISPQNSEQYCQFSEIFIENIYHNLRKVIFALLHHEISATKYKKDYYSKILINILNKTKHSKLAILIANTLFNQGR